MKTGLSLVKTILFIVFSLFHISLKGREGKGSSIIPASVSERPRSLPKSVLGDVP
nr:hypothetical protein [Cressdnaviricota sp.]